VYLLTCRLIIAKVPVIKPAQKHKYNTKKNEKLTYRAKTMRQERNSNVNEVVLQNPKF
jgi:hypothetical protein